MALFENFNNETRHVTAVGWMARDKREPSHLIDPWNMGDGLRLVDMETLAEPLCVLSVPNVCCKPEGTNIGLRRNHILVIKDRVEKWPGIFNETDWGVIDHSVADKRREAVKNQEEVAEKKREEAAARERELARSKHGHKKRRTKK
jgi:hypothetical protein